MPDIVSIAEEEVEPPNDPDWNGLSWNPDASRISAIAEGCLRRNPQVRETSESGTVTQALRLGGSGEETAQE